MILQLNDGTYTGDARTSSFAFNSNLRIQSSTFAGMTFSYGVKTFLQGVTSRMQIIGNPTSSFTWHVYNGSTELASTTIASTSTGAVAGSGTTFTSAMVGRGFKATGHTKWYR